MRLSKIFFSFLLLLFTQSNRLVSSETTLQSYKSLQEVQSECFRLLDALDQQPIHTINHYDDTTVQTALSLFDGIYDFVDNIFYSKEEEQKQAALITSRTMYKVLSTERHDPHCHIIHLVCAEVCNKQIHEKRRQIFLIRGTCHPDIHGNEIYYGIKENIYEDRTETCSMKELQNMFQQIMNNIKRDWTQANLDEYPTIFFLKNEAKWKLLIKVNPLKNEDCLWRCLINATQLTDSSVNCYCLTHNKDDCFIYLWIKKECLEQVLQTLELQLI